MTDDQTDSSAYLLPAHVIHRSGAGEGMNRTRLSRPIYIIARFAEMLIAAGSRVLNAAVFGGSTHQTLSARAFIDVMSALNGPSGNGQLIPHFGFSPIIAKPHGCKRWTLHRKRY